MVQQQSFLGTVRKQIHSICTIIQLLVFDNIPPIIDCACQLIERPGNRLQSFYVIDASQLRHARNVATLRLAEIGLVIHTLPLLLVLNVSCRSFLHLNLHNLTFREYYGGETLPWIRIEKATTHITICVLICYCTYDGTGISTSLENVLEPLSFTVKLALKGTEYSCNCF